MSSSFGEPAGGSLNNEPKNFHDVDTKKTPKTILVASIVQPSP